MVMWTRPLPSILYIHPQWTDKGLAHQLLVERRAILVDPTHIIPACAHSILRRQPQLLLRVPTRPTRPITEARGGEAMVTLLVPHKDRFERTRRGDWNTLNNSYRDYVVTWPRKAKDPIARTGEVNAFHIACSVGVALCVAQPPS